jgi:hypothetical protein
MRASAAVTIISRRAAQRDEWERICRACPYATYFHTPDFVDIFIRTDASRMTPATQLLKFSDGVEVIVPLVSRNFFGKLLSISFSMPGTTFGGWVAADVLTAAHTAELIVFLCGIRNLEWRENPYDPTLGVVALPQSRDDFTQAIDVRQGFAAASGRFDHAHRKAVKKAHTSGVSIVEASGFDQWESYFALYAASKDRWRRRGLLRNRGYDKALVRALYESPPGCRKLWLAQINGRAAAGIVCFYWNRHAVAWLGAGAAEFFACRPNNLLYEHAIRHAAESGYHWFDCNPSGAFKGVVEFKTHLGAQRLRSRVVSQRSALWRLAERMRSIV